MIIDQKLKSLVASERKITHEILLLIQTLDITKSYRELGYSSLFEYLTKEIGYSEGSAQRRISSARLMKQVPLVEKKLKSGELNLTQVSLAQTAFRQEEKAAGANLSTTKKIEILNQLQSMSTFDTQKTLKQNLPHFEIPKPKAVPSGSDKVFVTMEFSSVDWEKVQNLMAHFSHSVPDQKLESLLLYWSDQVEKKKQKQRSRLKKAADEAQVLNTNHTKAAGTTISNADYEDAVETSISNADQYPENLTSPEILPPLRRQVKSAWRKSHETPSSSNSLPKSVHASGDEMKPFRKRTKAPVQIKIQIRDRARDRCEFVSSITGRKCECKVFLEDEHIIPLAKGGSNVASNYRLFCRAHNQLMAKVWGVSESPK